MNSLAMLAIRLGAFACAGLPFGAWAQPAPLELKLALAFSGVQAEFARAWADAVNRDAAGAMTIVIHGNERALGRDQTAQLRQVVEGTADLALLITNLTPDRFVDADASLLPGLFGGGAESSVVAWRVLQKQQARGFGELQVIATYTGGARALLNTRFPLSDLASLKGKRVRVGSGAQAALLQGLGAEPVVIPINQAEQSFRSGGLDGIVSNVPTLHERNLPPFVPHHLVAPFGATWFALVMTRARLEALPETARAAIARNSGEAWSRRGGEMWDDLVAAGEQSLRAAAGHNFRGLTAAEQGIWNVAEQGAIDAWVKADPLRQGVIDSIRRETEKLRVGG